MRKLGAISTLKAIGRPLEEGIRRQNALLGSHLRTLDLAGRGPVMEREFKALPAGLGDKHPGRKDE